MRVLITGTPGTGKTKVATVLGRMLGWEVLHISEIAKKAEAIEGEDSKGEKEVDIYKLSEYLTPVLQNRGNVIFEGHLGCEIPCPAELVIVLRAHPDVLKKRMESRGYYKEKIDENILAELLDYCYQLADRNYSCNVLELDTSKKTAEQSARKIYSYICGEINSLDKINWETHLSKKTGKPSN